MSRADYLERFPSHAAADTFEQMATEMADDSGFEIPPKGTTAYWEWMIEQDEFIREQEREYAAKVQR